MSAFLLLLALAGADDFRWPEPTPFEWAFSVPAAPDSLVEPSITTVPSESVHRLTVRSPDGTAGSGSATQIGPRDWLTCKHVFDRQVSAVEIDGQQVAAKWCPHPTLDVAYVQADGYGPSAHLGEMTDSLSVYGQKTGLHRGTLSTINYSSGSRTIICPEPNTESGDSGAGVFNAAGELVGVHWGSLGNEVFFTPLSAVSSWLAPLGPAVAGAHSPSAPPGVQKPSVTILSPKTWDCPHCPAHRNQDWSGLNVKFEQRDGLPAYPATEWTDSRGVTRRLYGRYSPSQVRWSWERTQDASPAAPTDAAAAPTPQSEVERILAILQPRTNEVFVDYGSGDGRFLITAARKYGCRCVGVEIDPDQVAKSRAAVAMAGLQGKIEIIEGDALTTNVDAQVGVVYLWQDTLDALKDKLQKLDRFASVQHRVTGLPMTQYGDAYVWRKPQPARGVVWGGRTYYGPVCNSPNCAMCAAIRQGLGQQ